MVAQRSMTQHYDFIASAVLLIDTRGIIIGQLRDNKPTINDPGTVSLFGGTLEPNETPLQGAVRELNEETNLSVAAGDLKPFATYLAKTTLGNRVQLLHVYILEGIDASRLEVYEGQGAYEVKGLDDPLIAREAAYPAFAQWFKMKR
jgi:8-oxo-dGTP pyrophosphatase MutT (NUDIX family)